MARQDGHHTRLLSGVGSPVWASDMSTRVSVSVSFTGPCLCTLLRYGQLSGMVEPLAGVFGAFAVVLAEPILPYALAFAAGAMVYVVMDDIIPEAQIRWRASRDYSALSEAQSETTLSLTLALSSFLSPLLTPKIPLPLATIIPVPPLLAKTEIKRRKVTSHRCIKQGIFGPRPPDKIATFRLARSLCLSLSLLE